MSNDNYQERVDNFLREGCLYNAKHKLIKVHKGLVREYLTKISNNNNIPIPVSSDIWCKELLKKYQESSQKPRPKSLGVSIFVSIVLNDTCVTLQTAISLINEFFVFFDIKLTDEKLKNLFDFCCFHIQSRIDIDDIGEVSEEFRKFNDGYFVGESVAQRFAKQYNCQYQNAILSDNTLKWKSIYNK